VSLERTKQPALRRAQTGARLASDAKTEEAAKNIALIYKDILERGIPDTDQRISTVYNTSPIYPHIRQIYPKAQLDRFRKRFPDLLKNIKKESNTFTKHVTLIYDFIRTLGPEGVLPPYYLSGDENRRSTIRNVFTTKEFGSILDPGRADEVGQIGRGGMTTATLFTFHGKSWDLSFAALTPNNIVDRIDGARDRFEEHKDPLRFKLEVIGLLWELGAFLAQGETLQYLNPQGAPDFSFQLRGEGDRPALVLIKKLLTNLLSKSEGAELDRAFFKNYANLKSYLDTLSHDKKPRLIHQLFDRNSQKLSDAIREGHLTFSDKLRVMQTLARSFQAMQKKGIVHRDIKPDNVLVRFDESGAVSETMLFDFGTATKTVERPEFWKRFKQRTISWNDVTSDEINWLLNETAVRYSIAPGTKGYKPSDEGQKNLYWGEADLFALGATFYEILTGSKLDGARPQGEIDRLIDTTEAAPAALKNLLKRMLRVKLEKDLHPDHVVSVVDTSISDARIMRSPDALRAFIDRELPKVFAEIQAPQTPFDVKIKKLREARQRTIDFLLYLGDSAESRDFTVYSDIQRSNVTPYVYLSGKMTEIDIQLRNLSSSQTRRIAGARLGVSTGVPPEPVKPTEKVSDRLRSDTKPILKTDVQIFTDVAPDLRQEALEIARVVSRNAAIEGPSIQVPIFAAARGAVSVPLWIYRYSKVPGGEVIVTVSESDVSTRFRGSRTLISNGRFSREELLNGRRVKPTADLIPNKPEIHKASEDAFDIREDVNLLSDASPILRNVAYWKKQNLNLVNNWHKFINTDLAETPEGSTYVLSVPLESTFDANAGWVLSADFEESVRVLVRELEAQSVKGNMLISFNAGGSALSDKAKNRIEAFLQNVERSFGRNKVRLTLSFPGETMGPIEGVLSSLDPKQKVFGISIGFDYKSIGKDLDYDAESARKLKLRLFGVQIPKENETISTLGLLIVGTLEVRSRFAIPFELLPYVQRTKSRKLGISIFVIRPHRINTELKRFFVQLRSTETSA
ncbi:MAG TPA: hypothetical protein VD883_02240, partial [Candidatus Omnitrophota bacterium]|nr:hypothetical protein [Candidatus Omnitrophota bacterium]